MAEFQVQKADLRRTRVVETQSPPLGAGEIRVTVERFAFTANNLTYGVVGDQIGYWRFFPPRGSETTGWGVLPVWGFGEITATNAPEAPLGERLYGYFPPARDVVMRPGRISAATVTDGAAHRAALPPAYNRYQRVAAEPGYDRAMDDRRALLYPLHLTSYCLWDALQAAAWHGAERVLIVSASSKTSIGLAYALAEDPAAPPAVALTSARNQSFVEELGFYSASVLYDDLDALDASVPTVIVDMAGDGALIAALAARLGERLRFHLQVGLTHWEAAATPAGLGTGLDKSRSAFFFAPGHAETRLKELGPAVFQERSAAFLAKSAAESGRWMAVRTLEGLEALEALYPDIADGRIPAQDGVVVAPTV
ncbi:MAG: DUF2855 family protein [Pseudomonadota bacterium]